VLKAGKVMDLLPYVGSTGDPHHLPGNPPLPWWVHVGHQHSGVSWAWRLWELSNLESFARHYHEEG